MHQGKNQQDNINEKKGHPKDPIWKYLQKKTIKADRGNLATWKVIY